MDTMRAITHMLSFCGRSPQPVTIAVDHELPAHTAYHGVHRGEHDADRCECDQCSVGGGWHDQYTGLSYDRFGSVIVDYSYC